MSEPAQGLFGQALRLLNEGDAWLNQVAAETRAASHTLSALVHLAILRALLIWTALLATFAAAVLTLIENGMRASVALLVAALACTLTAVIAHLRWCARTRQLGGRVWLRGLLGLLLTTGLAQAQRWAKASTVPATPDPAPPAPDATGRHPAG